jgi:hypothetical protein
MPELSDRDRAILEFEQTAGMHTGSKDFAIRERFELSPARYYQLLRALIVNPAAVAAYPVVVGRLQEAARERAAKRAARTFL